MSQVKSPCENCGSHNFILVTQDEETKGAITRVLPKPEATPEFKPTVGTAVDLYACGDCGLVRLFAVRPPE